MKNELIEKAAESREVKKEQATVAGRRRLHLRQLKPQPKAYAAAGICSVDEAAAPGWKPPAGFFETSDPDERQEFSELEFAPMAIYKPEPGMSVVVFRGEDPRQKKDKSK